MRILLVRLVVTKLDGNFVTVQLPRPVRLEASPSYDRVTVLDGRPRPAGHPRVDTSGAVGGPPLERAPPIGSPAPAELRPCGP
jgi:hypothetical protein